MQELLRERGIIRTGNCAEESHPINSAYWKTEHGRAFVTAIESGVHFAYSSDSVINGTRGFPGWILPGWLFTLETNMGCDGQNNATGRITRNSLEF